jgi:hypothetical protein
MLTHLLTGRRWFVFVPMFSLALAVLGVILLGPTELKLWCLTALPIFGAVTVTYQNPVAGVVAPTAAQSRNTNRVTANVIATADADAAAVVVHNFGATAAQLATGNPIVVMTPLLQVAGGLSLWAITAQTANDTTATKSVAGGSGVAGAQLRVDVLRHSNFN